MRKHIVSIRTLSATLLFASASLIGAAGAQTAASLPSYDVELIIFRTLSSNASPEDWSSELREGHGQLEIPDDEQSATSTVVPAPEAASFPALPPARFKLAALEDTLRRSRNYQPLAHIGWTQPGFPRDAARFIPVNTLAPAASGLSGQIALTRGRYLHLTLDLAYDAPASATESAQRFVLRQTRRMRSNERHYIDHPKVGVIAVITPAGGVDR